jgi:hypothetical protein
VEVDTPTNASNAVWKQPLSVVRQLSASTLINPDTVEQIMQSVHTSLGAVSNVRRSETPQAESPMFTPTQKVVAQISSKQVQSSPKT